MKLQLRVSGTWHCRSRGRLGPFLTQAALQERGSIDSQGLLQTCTFRPSVTLSTESAPHYISIFTDSTGEARGTTWSLVSCSLETWGHLAYQGCQGSIFPSRALGMLSCCIQENSGPHMQKAWEKAACRFFFFSFLFVTGLERLPPAQHQGLPSSQVSWSRMGVLCSWSAGFLGPCPEHIHPATSLLVTLRQGHWEPDLGSGIDECLGVRTAVPMLYRAARIVAKLLCPFSMRLPVTRCQWVMCVL